ncbi:MAG: hypothetical protein ABSH14_10120 [Verrucomicrobiia bacterium]|jgi:hypothetical protein
MDKDVKELRGHIDGLYDFVITLMIMNARQGKVFASIADNINAELAALLRANATACETSAEELQEMRKRLPPL